MIRERLTSLCVGGALMLAVGTLPMLAAEADEEQAVQAHGEANEAAHGHGFHKHHLSFFLGATDGEIEEEVEGGSAIVEDEVAFTMGLDYEYRLNRRWGIGGLVDYAGEDFRSWVYGTPVVFHPTGALKLLVAPGIEDREDEDNEFLVRVGALYDFEVGGFTIAPALNVDFVDGEEVLVYGVNIGKGF